MEGLISLIIGIGLLILHIILSKKENKFLGLILPAINIVCSIFAVIGATTFSTMLDGQFNTGQFNLDVIIQGIAIFVSYNISTIILLGIYFVCRKKINKNKEIDKMNIKDL